MSACLPIVVSPGKCRDLSVSAFSFIRRHVNADLHLPIHADAGRKRSLCGGRCCYPTFTAIALRRHQDIHHSGDRFAVPGKCAWPHRDAVTYSKRFPLCRYEKAQGVNLGLEFFVSTIKAMATISDLHEIYAFQFGFARLTSKFVAFCCERDRVTEISAPLSSRLKLFRIASQ